MIYMEPAIQDAAALPSSLATPHARLLLLAPGDNIAVATADFPAGAIAKFDGGKVALIDAVPMGHKVAVAPIAAGEKIIKYGCPIGSALRPIRPGEHVHTHNIKSDYLPTRTR
jgi:hypothetical protein